MSRILASPAVAFRRLTSSELEVEFIAAILGPADWICRELWIREAVRRKLFGVGTLERFLRQAVGSNDARESLGQKLASDRLVRSYRASKRPLSKQLLDRMARVAEVVVHARRVFDSPLDADAFLTRPQRQLRGRRLIEVAVTLAGQEAVFKLLDAVRSDSKAAGS